jgi:hypothetical protein
MLTDEKIADLQEKISLARLASETSIKVEVKVLVEILEALSEKNETSLSLEEALEHMKNSKGKLSIKE